MTEIKNTNSMGFPGGNSWAAILVISLIAISPTHSWAKESYQGKMRIFIVDSYHKEYLWSQATHNGLASGLLKFHYLDSLKQASELMEKNQTTSSRAVIHSFWMDTKKKNTKADFAEALVKTKKMIKDFKPDVILVGDDNATNLIGNAYLDEDVPVVFWGVNGSPLKYGLLDSQKKPGHNVTGVYQAGYHLESLDLLKRLKPGVKTFAVLADDTPTGRAKVHEIKYFHEQEILPLKYHSAVVTNSYSKWKSEALRLSKEVDAFFMFNHNSLREENGKLVDQMTAGKWYLENIKIPECSHEGQFVLEGMLCTANDSGFNQGFEAIAIMNRILQAGEKPAEIASYAPSRGTLMVNRQRAKMLGITILPKHGIEEIIEKAKALAPVEGKSPKGAKDK